jgi:hypothetical protein
MRELRVERQKGYYGAFRALNIIVDGTPLGSIKQGETVVFEVPEIGQEIWGKMDWGETPRLSLHDYVPDKTVVFKGCSSFDPLKNLAVTKMPFKGHLEKLDSRPRWILLLAACVTKTGEYL